MLGCSARRLRGIILHVLLHILLYAGGQQLQALSVRVDAIVEQV